jgi:hypothetical protein
MTAEHVNPLATIFGERVQQVIGGGSIESWNDQGGRRHQEILEAMRAALEIITKECVDAWDAESVEEREARFAHVEA